MTGLLKSSKSKRIVFAALLTAGRLCLTGPSSAQAAEAASAPPAPVMTLLTPQDGAWLNAESLRVQALAVAVAPDRHASFLFEGEQRSGRNAGAIELVEVTIDQQVVARVSASPCQREFLLDDRLDLTGLADGPHTLSLTAFQGRRSRSGMATVSATFTLDRSLPLAPRNLVEAHATPAPFACFTAGALDGQAAPPPAHPDVRGQTVLGGQLVLGGQSDGIDFTRDRVVLAAGEQTVALEPGTVRCDRRGKVCRYENARDPLLKRLVLESSGKNAWRFQIAGGSSWPRDAVVHLRIGNDGGGFAPATGERIAGLRPVLDAARAGQETIGSAGGTVETTDAAGVVTRLIVPPGALTRDTLITATPLAAPPLAGQTADLHVGVKFEPEGLVFLKAARLELDFGAGTRPPVDDDFVYLVTSPLSRIPLVDNGRAGSVLVASLSHFSTVQAGGLAPLFGNLVDWDPRLTDAGALTFTELATLAEAVRVQLAMACTPGPECAAVDAALADLVQATTDAITALLPSCSADVAAPTRAAFDHWKTLIALAQGLGVDEAPILDCARNVLDALVTQVAAAGLANPSDAAVDSLDDLETQGRLLAFEAVASRAHDKKHDVLSNLIDRTGTTATGDPSLANLTRMIGLRGRAQAFAFADLERRVLEKSVAAARAAISRLRSACDVSATAPETEVAKEVARTWVTFVNQDPTVAPTLSADLRRVMDDCGGSFVTVVGGQWLTGLSGATGGYQTSSLYEDTDPPVHLSFSGERGTLDMNISVSGKTVAMDVTMDGTSPIANSLWFDAFAHLDFRFPRAGTLTVEINHGWLTQFDTSEVFGAIAFVEGPTGLLINNCLSASCIRVNPLPIPGAPAVVTVPVAAGSFLAKLLVTPIDGTTIRATGRIFTLTYTPEP
jgi:hypothetical protein